MSDYSVLVVGPRRGLIEVLRSRRIPYAVWQERPSRSWRDAQRVVVAPLWQSKARIKSQLQQEFDSDCYTHVIAGTETAVVAASVARRFFKARLSRITTVVRCRDKLVMKRYLMKYGIPMTPFLAESRQWTPSEVFDRLGGPVVRKARKSSGGKGITVIDRPRDLHLNGRGRHILEAFVAAPEASVESFVQDYEIRFTNLTYYAEKGHVNYVPGVLTPAVTEAILSLNRRVIQALKIQWGMTHLEVYLTKKGPLFGEIALRPPGGYIMNALTYAYGFNPWAALVAMELNEPFDFPSGLLKYAAVDVFHPGCGTVARIQGEASIRGHDCTCEFRVKVKPGDRVYERDGVGQDTGYLIHASDSPEARDRLQTLFRQHLTFEMEEARRVKDR
ncbi:MAG: ATP-grasp domain-containing protein [Phycisphaerae bacterium]|nr:ATP-grasp domain-containing protein [Phycisphaerae bacterium]